MGPIGDSVFISYNFDTASDIAEDVAEALKEIGMDTWWLKEPVDGSQLKITVDNALRNCSRTIVIWTTPTLSAWQQLEVHFMQGLLQDNLHSSDIFIVVRAKEQAMNSDNFLIFLEAAEYVNWSDRNSTVFAYLSNSRLGPLCLNLPSNINPKFDSDFKNGKLCPNGSGLYSFFGHFRDLKDNETVYSSPDAWVGFHWVFLQDPWNYFIQHPRPTITHNRRWNVGNVRIGTHVNKVHLAVVKDAEAHEWAKRRVLRGDFSGIPDDQFNSRFTIVDTLNVPGT